MEPSSKFKYVTTNLMFCNCKVIIFCRESALRCLENKVQLLLAYFIAYMDRNENLNFLVSNDTWTSKLWLDILASKDALSLSYSKLLVIPDLNLETKHISVLSSGFNGHEFRANFPFSWLLKDYIDETFENRSQDFSSSK